MTKTCNVLIIDDHEIIVEAYKNSLNAFLSNQMDAELIIDSAYNCESALKKLKGRQKYNLVLLDISLPRCEEERLYSGEDVGLVIRKLAPETKIIIITSFTDNFRIFNILSRVNPEGFLLKNDINSKELSNSVKKVFEGSIAYSQSILTLIRKKINNLNLLDDLDIKILLEITNGTKPKEMIYYIPLSKAGIEKRKRILRETFETKDNCDRQLIISAREKGFI